MTINAVISELNRIRDKGLITDYAIGGAVAATSYIETSATEDVDVFVVLNAADAGSLAPISRIWADLVANGAKQDGMYLVIGNWPVQILSPSDSLYEEAIAGAREQNFGDKFGKIMSPEHLAAIAIQTGRSKDYQRVSEFLQQKQVPLETLTELVYRFGLEANWKKFLHRYPLDDVDG